MYQSLLHIIGDQTSSTVNRTSTNDIYDLWPMQCKTEDRATIMTLLGNLIINLMANCVGCYQVSNLCHLPWCEAANINHNIQGKTIMLQGVPYHWIHFVFVIFSGSRAHTEELFIAIG